MAGASCAIWALSLLDMAGLSLAYPFDGHAIIHPPAGSAGEALEVVAYAMLPVGLIVLGVARWLLLRAYRGWLGVDGGR